MNDNEINNSNIYDPESPKAKREFMSRLLAREKVSPSHSIMKKSPDLAAQALWMLSQGETVEEAHRCTGISRVTIRELLWRNEDTVSNKKKEMAEKYAILSSEFTDILAIKAARLQDDPDQLDAISPEKIATTIGILTDKAIALSNTSVTPEKEKKGLSIEDAAKLISEIQKNKQQKTIDID